MSDLEQKSEQTPDKKDSHVSDSLASDTLKNVFKAAGKEENSIPLEVLESEAVKKAKALPIMRIIIAAAIVILLATAVPLLTGGFGSAGIGTVSTSSVSDTGKPTLVSSRLDGNSCILTFKAGANPIDWNGVYALDSSGSLVIASSVNESESSVTFPLNDGNLTIFVPDTENNILTLKLKVQTD